MQFVLYSGIFGWGTFSFLETEFHTFSCTKVWNARWCCIIFDKWSNDLKQIVWRKLRRSGKARKISRSDVAVGAGGGKIMGHREKGVCVLDGNNAFNTDSHVSQPFSSAAHWREAHDGDSESSSPWVLESLNRWVVKSEKRPLKSVQSERKRERERETRLLLEDENKDEKEVEKSQEENSPRTVEYATLPTWVAVINYLN